MTNEHVAWIEANEYHAIKHSESTVRQTLAELGLDPNRYVKVRPQRNDGWRGYELSQDETCRFRDVKP